MKNGFESWRNFALRPCRRLRLAKPVKEVLERTGTQDIASTGEAGMGYAKNYKPLSRAAAGGIGNS